MNADGDAMRGLPRNQLCVCTATDGERCVVLLCGMGQPTPKKTLAAYSGHISPASVLIHDGATCHRAIAAHCRRDEIHLTAETKGLPDKRNPMEPVNKVHRFLEPFLKRHGGYKGEELKGWLNLFAFRYTTPPGPRWRRRSSS